MEEREENEPRTMRYIDLAERGAYYGVALFLLATIVLVFASAVFSITEIVRLGPLEVSVQVLDKLLLIFIFAELLGTISTIVREREVTAEPFLLIGLIAVVRRILGVTVSIEQNLGTPRFDDLLLELAVLTVLVVALAAALFFTRRADRRGEP
jgi:uncharacterized membrane protein (DUF373 family)